MEWFAAERGGLLHQCDAGEPQAQIDRQSFWRQFGRADRARQAVFLLRQRMGSDRAAHRHAHDRSQLTAFQQYVLQQLSPPSFRSISRCSLSMETPAVHPLAMLGCPLAAAGQGCANRQSVSHSSDDHEQVQTARIDYNINRERYDLVSFSGRHGRASCLHRPHQPAVRCGSPAASLLLRGRIHARVLAEPGELLQSRILLV